MEERPTEPKKQLFSALHEGNSEKASRLFRKHEYPEEIVKDLGDELRVHLRERSEESKTFIKTLFDVAEKQNITGFLLDSLNKSDTKKLLKLIKDPEADMDVQILKTLNDKDPEVLKSLAQDLTGKIVKYGLWGPEARVVPSWNEASRLMNLLLGLHEKEAAHKVLVTIMDRYMIYGMADQFKGIYEKLKENPQIMEKFEENTRKRIRKAWKIAAARGVTKNLLEKDLGIDVLMNIIIALRRAVGENKMRKMLEEGIDRDRQGKVKEKVLERLTNSRRSYVVSDMFLSPCGDLENIPGHMKDFDFVKTGGKGPVYLLRLDKPRGFSLCVAKLISPYMRIEMDKKGGKRVVEKINDKEGLLEEYRRRIEEGKMSRSYPAENISRWGVSHKNVLESFKILHKMVSSNR